MVAHVTKHFLFTICLVTLFFVGVEQVYAATLSLSPSTGVYTAGATFTTRVVVNTQGAAINAAEATIKFNPAQLSVVSVSKGSIFSLWAVEPSFSNTAGTINFGGGSPTGYTGGAGSVVSITWRSKGAGDAKVSFSNGSVLAADGRGTNVVRSLNGGTYTIAAADVQPEPEVIEYVAPANTPAAPVVTSATHPSNGWSQDTTATLSWSVPSDVTGVRTLLDGNAGSIPTRVYETPLNSLTLDELENGIQYFHIQFRNAEGWGRVTHYRLAVDTEAPTSFTIERSDEYDSASPTQLLQFTIDEPTSHIARYQVQHNGGEPYEYIDETGSSTMKLENLAPGQHSFVIEAFDAAGNSRVATFTFAVEAFGAPEWTDYPSEFSASVVPVLTGITRANAQVFARITPVGRGAQGSVPMEYEIQADGEGVFRLIPDGRLPEGVYEVSAYAIDSHGSQSERSDVIRLSVTPPGYVAVGQFMVNVMSVFIPLLALIVLGGLLIAYGVLRLRKIKTHVHTETADALRIVDEQFTQLATTLDEQAKDLAASRKTKKLTKAEQTLFESVNSAIRTAKDTITREVDEVDDVIGS